MVQGTTDRFNRPAAIDARRQQLHKLVDHVANYCESYDGSFFAFEKKLRKHVWALARLLLGLFLLAAHLRLQEQDKHYPGYRLLSGLARRTLRTMFGKVRYKRAYWVKRQGGGGFHPLDAELGLTRDGFSPWVMSLACRLSTYLSYAKSTLVMKAFWGWSPSTETVEQWVLGLAREGSAYMASSPPFPKVDGEVLVIEVDGKAVPTAREEELAKRRGPRQHKANCQCGCQRHRGQSKRRRPEGSGKSRKKRRKRGDKSKNGRSATLAAMYTLHRGDDGKLHGPINKRVWGSFASRKKMIQWVRAEATRRGFGPGTDRLVQIVVDGERCLAKRLRKLFPKAILTLDIRHVEERLWLAGRAFHPEGSPELTAWVEKLRGLLYDQGGKVLVARLKELRQQIACRGPGTKKKRQPAAGSGGHVDRWHQAAIGIHLQWDVADRGAIAVEERSRNGEQSGRAIRRNRHVGQQTIAAVGDLRDGCLREVLVRSRVEFGDGTHARERPAGPMKDPTFFGFGCKLPFGVRRWIRRDLVGDDNAVDPEPR